MGEFINEYHRRHYEACMKEFALYAREQLSPENLMRNAIRIRRESKDRKRVSAHLNQYRLQNM